MTKDILLDTHALIWLINGDENLSIGTRELVKKTCKQHSLLVAAISVWEIGMLQAKGKISLAHPLQQWIEKIDSLPYIKLIPLTADIAIESCNLPGEFHGDPADRMLVATARILNVPFMTRDKKIENYGQKGYIEILAC